MIYVVSVPHTGTRSLLAHLGVKDWPGHQVENGLLHFGYDDLKIKALGDVEVHIPVRDPIETLESWHTRRLGLKRCVVRHMAKLVKYANPNAKYYDVHQLNIPKVGVGKPHAGRPSLMAAMDAWEEYATPEIRAFYEQYYGEI